MKFKGKIKDFKEFLEKFMSVLPHDTKIKDMYKKH